MKSIIIYHKTKTYFAQKWYFFTVSKQQLNYHATKSENQSIWLITYDKIQFQLDKG